MPGKKIREFLDSHQVKYISVTHSPAYTAQQIAQVAHIPAKELAKTVMIKIDGKMSMAVLPADHKVDFDLLKNIAGADRVEIASEQEFRTLFPDCEVGAMPPFGNLYDMEVYVHEALTEDEEIGFNAGSHSEIIKMAYKDFESLVKPKIVDISIK
jgi:Ala-tRNA(Pro) deacylase